MAKYFIIKLTSKSKVKTFASWINEDGTQDKNVEKKIRDVELLALEFMFKAARQNAKNMDQAFLVTDCVDQIKNITDKESTIRFTQEDIQFLKSGFEAAHGSTIINFWFENIIDLLKQIRNPEEEGKKENAKT
jgi:hypothetical protein